MKNSVRTSVAAFGDWQTVTFEVPAKGAVIHVRLHPPGGSAVEISSITLAGATAADTRTCNFSPPASAP